MPKKGQKTQVKQSSEGPQAVAEVFSLQRDIDALNPYHLDGDAEMYTEQKMEIRNDLRTNPKVVTEIDAICKLYKLDAQGKVNEFEYKKVQKGIALILRPEIEKDELEFVVQQDWEYDADGNSSIELGKLRDCLFELVDVWTVGASEEEYISFCRLLKKKLSRSPAVNKA